MGDDYGRARRVIRPGTSRNHGGPVSLIPMFSRANSSTNIVRTSYRQVERSEPSPSVIIPSKDEDRAEAARRLERVGAERERERRQHRCAGE